MKKNALFKYSYTLPLFATVFFFFFTSCRTESTIVSYQADLKKHQLKLYWRDDENRPYQRLGALIDRLESKGEHVLFAMNGGMFKADHSPLGLFIREQQVIIPLDTASGSGNFYLKPNGVFYTTTNNDAVICTTWEFKQKENIRFATQSGPMLITDGKIHPAFNKSSTNLNIRNGVGILPGNKVLFAMSKKEINLFDFAMFFRNAGCTNALYLDGYVSRMYAPSENWLQTDGDFGVIIAVTSR